MSTYQGQPGGPSDPATPGPYCLAICWCGTCPQHQQQHDAAAVLRDQEYAARVRQDGARQAQRTRRRAA